MDIRKHPIATLVKKDILLETRQQYTLYGILLYVASTTFVIYLSMGQPEQQVWNGLFWITQLFICINAVAKSFLQESRGRMLYFYSIAGATDFIIAKLIFNLLLMLVMSSICLALFALLLGNPVNNMGTFIGITLLGGASLSLVFTFLAAIAARAQQSAALMAIMGFPIIIPQILLLMKISVPAFSDVVMEGWLQLVYSLAGLDVLIIALAIILFPFLWKD
ncbi:heme exporter protein CcmB [Parasediminibacterium sp. JCM 36343]|uniref:heme exporter protein CcmB n=1 Tax=Parasediminibacterium sp. JCM 36343 TaxID=3374279 RepID=UPI00397DF7BF